MTQQTDLVRRESIIELLTDEEVSSVSTVESEVKLDEGDEFLDLERLDKGVERADGVLVHMGSVLARKAVRDDTWGRIVELLSSEAKAAARPPVAARRR